MVIVCRWRRRPCWRSTMIIVCPFVVVVVLRVKIRVRLVREALGQWALGREFFGRLNTSLHRPNCLKIKRVRENFVKLFGGPPGVTVKYATRGLFFLVIASTAMAYVTYRCRPTVGSRVGVRRRRSTEVLCFGRMPDRPSSSPAARPTPIIVTVEWRGSANVTVHLCLRYIMYLCPSYRSTTPHFYTHDNTFKP